MLFVQVTIIIHVNKNSNCKPTVTEASQVNTQIMAQVFDFPLLF